MRKLLLVLMAFCFTNINAQTLIISEYIEGSSYNKALELYNATSATIDLSNYELQKDSNGDDDFSTMLSLSGTLAAGETYVISRNEADAAILAVTDLEESPVGVTNFNGNDQIRLVDISSGSNVIDHFGVSGDVDFAKDVTYVRLGSVTTGQSSASQDPATNGEWVEHVKDYFTDLGSHSGGTFSTYNDISAFVIENQQGSSIISSTDHTVAFAMVEGADITALIPTITVSAGATISPESGVAQDFTNSVTYTVTAEDGSTTQEWIVTCNLVAESTVLFEDDFEDSTFDKWTVVSEVGDQVWSIDGTHGVDGSVCGAINGYEGGNNENEDWIITSAINLSEVTGAKLTFYTACNYNGDDLEVKYSIDYSGSGSPSSATWTDFTGFTLSSGGWTWVESGDIDLSAITSATTYIAFVYKSTSSDGKAWEIDNVKVTGVIDAEPSTETDILTFVLEDEVTLAAIDATNHTIAAKVLVGTDITALTPTISLSDGATVSPASGVAQDFTNAVTYTVTAEDGTTTQDWTVTVTEAEALSSQAEILTFSFTEEVEPAVIDSASATVNSLVAYGTDVTSLTPTFTISAGAQVSETVNIDFTNPYTVSVQAQDKETIKDWVVTVEVDDAPSVLAEITAFELDELIEPVVIDSDLALITGTVKAGTDASSLAPTILISADASISPAGAQDFSDSVIYVVVAEDTTIKKEWVIKIVVEPTPEVSIYNIQYSTATDGESPMLGEAVIIRGVITAFDNYGFYMQDSAKAWNGIYIYAPDYIDALNTKDPVKVEGFVNEYFGLTQLSNVIEVKKVGEAASLPAPIKLDVSDIDEPYESLFTVVEDLTCVDNEITDDSWKVSQGSEELFIGNHIFTYAPEVGEEFESITGIIAYKYNQFRLLPRKGTDIVNVVSVNEDAFAAVRLYPNPVKNNLTITNIEDAVLINVVNITGKIVEQYEVNSTLIELNTSNYSNGIYFLNIVLSDGESKAYKIIK